MPTPIVSAEIRGIDGSLTKTWRGERVPADVCDAALAARNAYRAR